MILGFDFCLGGGVRIEITGQEIMGTNLLNWHLYVQFNKSVLFLLNRDSFSSPCRLGCTISRLTID